MVRSESVVSAACRGVATVATAIVEEKVVAATVVLGVVMVGAMGEQAGVVAKVEGWWRGWRGRTWWLQVGSRQVSG